MKTRPETPLGFLRVAKSKLLTVSDNARRLAAICVYPELIELEDRNEAKASSLKAYRALLVDADRKRDDDAFAIHKWMNEAFYYKWKQEEERQRVLNLQRLLRSKLVTRINKISKDS